MNVCFIGHFTAGGTESATFLVANRSITFDYLEEGSVLKRIWFLKTYLKKNKIDVLITVESMTGIFSIVATRLSRCKHIVWEHANYYQNQGSRWIQKIRQIELCSADAYVVLTERDRNNFIRNFRIKTKLEQIYNMAKPQGKHLYDMDSKIIVSVGHLRKIKNFIVIPDIAKIVFSKHREWQWKIYGDIKGNEYHAIKNKVETGPDEIIQDGVNGYLIPAYELKTMSEKICELIENDNLRKDFSDDSKDRMELFSEEQILEKWKLLLDIICKG